MGQLQLAQRVMVGLTAKTADLAGQIHVGQTFRIEQFDGPKYLKDRFRSAGAPGVDASRVDPNPTIALSPSPGSHMID